MMSRVWLLLTLCLLSLARGGAAPADGGAPRIGESEIVFTLAPSNEEVRGLAVDEVSSLGPRLLVLDRSGRIFGYRLPRDSREGRDALELLGVETLRLGPEGATPASPRGLTFALEDGTGVLYFLNWDDRDGQVTSELWRVSSRSGESSRVDLSLYPYRIGDREVLDLACDDGRLLVCFDATGHGDRSLRVRRGIIELGWNGSGGGRVEFIRHMPDAGTLPSRGLCLMELGGARYLWGTVGDEHVYCADRSTGRGLFQFERPSSVGHDRPCWGLAFGNGALWVPESAEGADRVHRVNVTENLDAPRVGPRVLRRVRMTIRTEPEGPCENAGAVYHYYSRPYANEPMPNQGLWLETETVGDVSGAPNSKVESLTYDPAGDASSRQHILCVEYPNAAARSYASEYEVDLWTRPYRKFVYPHRVDRNAEALAGMDYLADDPELFSLSDTKTYASFIARVEAHMEAKYGAPADMRNPYWAARNVVEYIQDHYYYPVREKHKPAAVDYGRQHYDANPANLKIELSARAYDKSQIIACSGTSVMVTGAMRYLGIPARWLGTGTEEAPAKWDTNQNGLLDEDETAGSTNGHRYTQVWLGSRYGWICFDATPTRPDFDDFDPPPPLQPQWRYMERAAAGHRKDRRIVFNVGSALYRPLYREFEYDEALAVDNNCGGDQRYNLQGRFEKPELWKLAGHRIRLRNLCFIEDVEVSGPKDATEVTWALKGEWQRIPEATVSIYLERVAPDGGLADNLARVAESIPYDAGRAVVDLSRYSGESCRILIRKDGDPETGGCSPTFTPDDYQ